MTVAELIHSYRVPNTRDRPMDEPRPAPSFHALISAFLDTYRNKASYHNYRRICAQYFDGWREYPTDKEVRAWHKSLAPIPDHANKALSFLRSCFRWAKQEGLYEGENPALGIKQHATQSRDRVMSEAELQRVREGLDHFAVKAAALLALLMDTGCRPIEARTLTLHDLDMATGRWVQYHTKNRRIHTTYVSQQARERVAKLCPSGSFLFAGAESGRCWSESGIDKMWTRERARFDLPDVRLHDFRRSFATHLYRLTKDRPLVKRCLNHHDGDVTDVYLRIQYEDLVAPLQALADRFCRAGQGPVVLPALEPTAHSQKGE